MIGACVVTRDWFRCKSTMTTDDERYVDYLDFSGFSWKRPECPTRVWRVVDGRRKTPDGKIPRFSIQEVPEDLEDDVIDFMATYLIAEGPFNVGEGMKDDPLTIREFRTLWRDFLRQGISVVALTVNSDSTVKPMIVGANMLAVLTVEDGAVLENLMKFQSIGLQKAMSVHIKLMDECNVLGKYGVDKYLTASGLCVHPLFRRQGLGEELLRVRDDIRLAYQIPISETVSHQQQLRFWRHALAEKFFAEEDIPSSSTTREKPPFQE